MRLSRLPSDAVSADHYPPHGAQRLLSQSGYHQKYKDTENTENTQVQRIQNAKLYK